MIWRLTPVRLIPEVKLKGDVIANRSAKPNNVWSWKYDSDLGVLAYCISERMYQCTFYYHLFCVTTCLPKGAESKWHYYVQTKILGGSIVIYTFTPYTYTKSKVLTLILQWKNI